MKNNSNIFKINRITNCHVCGTHFQQLFKAHNLCRQCFHGIKAGIAIYAAVKELRLSR